MIMLTESMRKLVLHEYDTRMRMSINTDRNVSPDILHTCPMPGNVGTLQRYLDSYLKEIRWGASNEQKYVPKNIADSFEGANESGANESGWKVNAAFPYLLRALLPSKGWSVISQHIIKTSQALLQHGEVVNDETEVIFVSSHLNNRDKMEGSRGAMILVDELPKYDLINSGLEKIGKITQTYTLRAAALSLKRKGQSIGGHAVAGFVCDGKQAVYDSMTREATVVDWKTIHNSDFEFARKFTWNAFTGALYVRADL
jgi:hypothetical protein